MELKSQELIRQIKDIKEKNKITYNQIMEEMSENGSPTISLTTLRRVFANRSETRASSFNYEETLLPIARAMKRIDGSVDESPQGKEIQGLKAVLSVQNEELDRIMEIKDRLDTNVSFLTAQIDEKDKLIKRLIDRLDQKDDIIAQFIIDMKQKDEIIKKLIKKE